MESQRGRFELEEISEEEYQDKLRNTRTTTLTVPIRESLYVGSPREGQYLKLRLVGYDMERARIVAFEKVEENEEYLGTFRVKLNRQYRLVGTSFHMRFEPNEYEGALNLKFKFSASKNVDVVRGRVLRRENTFQ